MSMLRSAMRSSLQNGRKGLRAPLSGRTPSPMQQAMSADCYQEMRMRLIIARCSAATSGEWLWPKDLAGEVTRHLHLTLHGSCSFAVHVQRCPLRPLLQCLLYLQPLLLRLRSPSPTWWVRRLYGVTCGQWAFSECLEGSLATCCIFKPPL